MDITVIGRSIAVSAVSSAVIGECQNNRIAVDYGIGKYIESGRINLVVLGPLGYGIGKSEGHRHRIPWRHTAHHKRDKPVRKTEAAGLLPWLMSGSFSVKVSTSLNVVPALAEVSMVMTPGREI